MAELEIPPFIWIKCCFLHIIVRVKYLMHFPQHLECDNSAPADNAYDEMICAGCMREHNFLWKYATKHAGYFYDT